MAKLPPISNYSPRRNVNSLEKDIRGEIKRQCVQLAEMQSASLDAVQRALRYLQLREQGHSQLHSIRSSAYPLRLSPLYRPYHPPPDYIDYEAIESAYHRFEQRHQVVNGRIRSRSHRRYLSY